MKKGPRRKIRVAPQNRIMQKSEDIFFELKAQNIKVIRNQIKIKTR